MDKEVLKYLESVDSKEWAIIVLRLTKYAGLLLDRISWRTGVPPKGLMAEDIALESIKAVFDGTRKWNPSSNPGLQDYLKSVAKSKVSQLYKSKEYNITDRYAENEAGIVVEELLKKADPSTDHAVHIVGAQPKGPDGVLFDLRESEQEGENDKRVADSFLEAIEGDGELEELALIIMEGHKDILKRPREIAKQMGKDEKYIYNLTKRFKRKCAKFRDSSTVN